MKWIFMFVIVVSLNDPVKSQETNVEGKNFQIKVELLELVYSFPRIGIGFSATAPNHNVWTTFHYGWDEIATFYVKNHFDGQYSYFGISTGANKLISSGSGYYLLGGQITYDNTNTPVREDVFYDRKQNSAVLFDSSRFHRYRIGLFLQNGFEVPMGNAFTIEFSAGGGVRYINNRYEEVINPLVLVDVPPLKVRNRTFYKYAGASWKPALMGSIKVGIKL